AADPERGWCRSVVDKDSSEIRRPRKKVLDELSRLWIETNDAIGELTAGPHVPIFVAGHIVGPRTGRRHRPLLKHFLASIEHPNPIAVVLAEPETILRVHHPATRPRAGRRCFVDGDL